MSTQRIFGFTDIHMAMVDEPALELALRAQAYFKPTHTVQGGDLIDASPFSRFPRRKLDDDAEYDYINTEILPCQKFLDRAQRQTKDGRFTWIMGNHDDWMERWLAGLTGSVGSSLRSLRPSTLLRLTSSMSSRTNFTVIPYTASRAGDTSNGRLMLGQKLMVVHGWSASKYCADKHLQMAKPYSVVYHHSHRAEQRTSTMADGHSVTAMNAGCLCLKQPVYALSGMPTEWTSGFWVCYLGTKSFSLYSIPILGRSGKRFCILPDGKEIRT